MTQNIQTPFLITTRVFPEEPIELSKTLSKTYVDIALAVNSRQISIFDKFQANTGERWFNDTVNTQKKQTFRQVYSLPATAAGVTTPINHNISSPSQFTHIYGTCITNFPDFRPIPYTSATLITDQIQINVNSTQILVTNGATADNILSGIIVLEYLLN